MVDDLDRALANTAGGWAGDAFDATGAFVKSMAESIPELIGITPSEETLRFRGVHPIAGFASQLAGTAVPYMGWFKGLSWAAKAGLGAARAVEAAAAGTSLAEFGTAAGAEASAARLAANPFLQGARSEAIRQAPFEIGRLALSQGFGDHTFGEMLFDTGLNLAFGAGVGGVVQRVAGMPKVAPRLGEIAPETDALLAPQLKIRSIDELLAAEPAHPDKARILDLRQELASQGRGETPPTGFRYNDPRTFGKDTRMEDLFAPGPTGMRDVDTMLPVTGKDPHTFDRPEEWQQTFRLAGIEPEAVDTLTQYPRILQVDRAKAETRAAAKGEPTDFTKTLGDADWLEQKISSGMQRVGDGWFMQREPDGGMFVLAKKVVGDTGDLVPKPPQWIGQPAGGKGRWATWTDQTLIPADAKNVRIKELKPTGKVKPGIDDRWVMFKTDQPGAFLKEQQAVVNGVVAHERWVAGSPVIEALAHDPGPVGKTTDLVNNKFSKQHYLESVAAAGGVDKIKGMVGAMLKPLANSAPARALGEFANEYATVAARQFLNHPVANWVHNSSRTIQEGMENYAQTMFGGTKQMREGQQFLLRYVQTPGRDLSAIYHDLHTEGKLDEFMRLYRQRIGAEGAKELADAGHVSQRTAELAAELESRVKEFHGERQKAGSLVGRKEEQFTPGSYGIPLRWEGEYMHLVRDEAGAIRGISAGASAKVAGQRAEALATQLGRETGAKFRPAEAFVQHGDTSALPEDAKKLLARPGGLAEPGHIRGFKWDQEQPRIQDLLSDVQEWTQGTARAMGTDMREGLLARHLDQVRAEDPSMARALAKRWDQMSGREGEFSKATNKVVDKVLTPLGFGSNSASKIAAVSNTGMVHLTQGAVRIAAPLQNILSILQTGLAEGSFLMNAPDSAMLRRYGMTVPAVGSQGVVGSISAIAPVKAMWAGLREMWSPSKEFLGALEIANNSRVLGARVAEDFIGQNRNVLRDWRGQLTSAKGVAEWLLALSDFMLVRSEEFARTLSFATSWKILGEWHGVKDPLQRQLMAHKFVENTNYLYGGADRPVMFTGPVGSTLGLFKNWQLNFLGAMAEYSNLGMTRGVWSPLLWQTMSTAAVGGIAATPLYWVANGAANLFSQKRLMQVAYDEWGDGADGLMFGLPAALTGVSISSLMTVPGANPMKDATQLVGIAGLSRMQNLGSAVKAMFDNWQATGQHPATDPDVRGNLIKAFAPVVVQRSMQMDFESGTVRNIATGLPSAKGLSTIDSFLYAAGLNPVGLERQSAATTAIYEDREAMKNTTRAFGDAMAEALLARNSDAARNITQRAVAVGVDPAAMFRGAATRMRQDSETSAERLAKPGILAGWTSVLGYQGR